MPFQDTNMHAIALKKGVLPTQIYISGVPLKEDFFIPHNQQDIRIHLTIPPKKTVILLLMGFQGIFSTRFRPIFGSIYFSS